MDAAKVLGEILDHFVSNGTSPEDAWAFCDDYTSLGLDHRSPDGTKFWLDLNRDGTIHVLWKAAETEVPQTLVFTLGQGEDEK